MSDKCSNSSSSSSTLDEGEQRQDGPVDRPVAHIRCPLVLKRLEREVGCGEAVMNATAAAAAAAGKMGVNIARIVQ
jgi:hypothetical protein